MGVIELGSIQRRSWLSKAIDVLFETPAPKRLGLSTETTEGFHGRLTENEKGQTMTRRTVPILLCLALLWLPVSSVHAASFGRVSISVKSTDGTAIPGVKVLATCPEIAYTKELETDKKGKLSFSVVDSSKQYLLRFEHEGFVSQEVTVKPQLGGTLKRDLFLEPISKTREAPKSGELTLAQERFNTGVEASQNGDKATARASFLEAVELDPNLTVAHLGLAGLYLESNELPAGLAAAERAVELDTNNVLARRLLYELHSRLGNTAEAARILELLSQIDEGGEAAAMIFNEGTAAYRVGDARIAKERFARALEIDPSLTAAMQALTIVYFKEGSLAEAAAMCERLIALEPGSTTALRLRWDIYRTAGESDKEREAFRALAAVDTDALLSDLLGQGVTLFENGELAAAQETFERILEIRPEHPRAHYRLGVCLISNGRTEEAKEHLEKFLALAPSDPGAENAKEMLTFLQ